MTTNKYVETAKRRVAIFDSATEFNHRSATILFACDIEDRLTELLSSFFTSIQENRRDSNAVSLKVMKDKLFEFNRGIVGGIYKANKIAMYLNLISYELGHDIDKVILLRNAYAHKKDSGQLSVDESLFKFITDTFYYKKLQAQLAGCSEQGVFSSFREYTIDELDKAIETWHLTPQEIKISIAQRR